MSLDYTVLRLLKKRDSFERLSHAVPAQALEPATQTLLSAFKAYFKEFPEVQLIDPDPFRTWFLSYRMPKLTDESQSLYSTHIRNIAQDVPPELEAGLMERLVSSSTAFDTANLLLKWQDGEEVDLYASLRDLVDRHENQIDRKVKVPFVEDSIEDLLLTEENEDGIQWRLRCLNESMRPLRPGDFGIVAGRVDSGKTTFFCSELTFMAKQLDKLWPDEGRCILWFNNEGPGSRIKQRLYQSALNATIPELIQKVKNGTINGAYSEATGGRTGIIHILDVHCMFMHELEDIIKKYKPGIIVYDMIDNVQFGGDLTNGGTRTDQVLEAMYQKARNTAVKYDCIALATSQLSADAEGVPYPNMSMLKDSKTGKQGTADFMITLGQSADIALQNSRFIGTPKNKLHRQGGNKLTRTEVVFDGGRARYVMPDN